MLLVYINCTQIQILVAQVAPHIFFTLLANDVFLFAVYSYLSGIIVAVGGSYSGGGVLLFYK